jgi:hypothetical protein
VRYAVQSWPAFNNYIDYFSASDAPGNIIASERNERSIQSIQRLAHEFISKLKSNTCTFMRRRIDMPLLPKLSALYDAFAQTFLGAFR